MNRRRGERRLFRKPDFAGIAASLKRLRLPSWSKKNRRKVTMTGLLSRDATTEQEGAGDDPRAPASAKKRRGIVGWVLGFLMFAAPVAAAVFAFVVPLLGVRAYDYVMQSGYFSVREVIVDHATRTGSAGAPFEPHLTREALLQVAGIDAGTHVLDADIDKMTERLMAEPWVRWAHVERELPDKLVVHVVEHRPSAYLAANELYVVDELGVPFAVAPADLTLRLPVISGIEQSRLDEVSESPAIARELLAALNVLQIWANQGLSQRYPVGELRLQGAGAVALVLESKATGTATEIVLGRGPFREKLFRAEWVLEHLRSIGKSAEYVLLDLADDATRSGSDNAIEMGGARVVVKTDLGPESGDTAGRRPAPMAVPVGDQGVSPAKSPKAAAKRPSKSHASGSDAASPEQPTTPEPDVDPEGPEMAPISGGRPAAEDGQE